MSTSIQLAFNTLRPSAATYIDAAGNMQLADMGEVRTDHSLISPYASIGIMTEGASTNLYALGNTRGYPTTPNWVASGTTNALGSSLDIPPLYAPTVIVLKHSRNTTNPDTNVVHAAVTGLTIGQMAYGSFFVWIPTDPTLTAFSISLEGGVSGAVGGNANMSLRDQWQRMGARGLLTATATNIVPRMIGATGDVIYTTCWQLEAYASAASATSYIPTIGTIASRAADFVGSFTQLALSTSIQLVSGMACIASMSASITTVSSGLQTDMACASSISASLTTGISLANSVQSLASETAALTTGILLASTSSCVATQSAAITTGILLAATLTDVNTNYVRNPRAEGAVAGIPGTLPSLGWSFGSAGGVGRQIVGTGTIGGIPYVDVRMFGIVSTGAQLYINHTFDATASGNNQTWTASVYLQVISDVGTYTVPSYNLVFPLSPSTTYLSTATMTAASLSTFARKTVTFTTNNPAMSTLSFSLWSGGASSTLGNNVDLTLRIGAPQLERGTSAAAVILPPIGSPAISTLGSYVTTNLTAGILLACLCQDVASTSAILDAVSSVFVSACQDVATTSAVLTTAIKLAVSCQDSAAASASLAAISPVLAANCQGTASFAGSLSTGIRLAAACQDAASSGAALAPVSSPLQAGCAGLASSTSSLSTIISLAAVGASVASLQGALSTSIRLLAACQDSASSTASLAPVSSALGASLQDAASGSGTLSTGIRLASSAPSVASVSVSLSAYSRIYANCVSAASILASISTAILVQQSNRIVVVHADNRSASIRMDIRTVSVPADRRSQIVLNEIRYVVVPADKRTADSKE